MTISITRLCDPCLLGCAAIPLRMPRTDPLDCALADPVLLGDVRELRAGLPCLDDLLHDSFAQPINHASRDYGVGVGSHASLWILVGTLLIFPKPQPGTSQQVSAVSMVGVSPDKAHHNRRSGAQFGPSDGHFVPWERARACSQLLRSGANCG